MRSKVNPPQRRRILRQKRMLELEYQLNLEHWSAWRRGKATGVQEFDSASGGARGHWRW
ncbi:MAG: hypothetical protein ACLQOO_13905 [Terriglobia bacterium]